MRALLRAEQGAPREVWTYLAAAEPDQIVRAAKTAAQWDRSHRPQAVWITLNPIDPTHPSVASRSRGRTVLAGQGGAIGDAAILRTRWLAIDLDPRRPKGADNSTDAERETARLVSEACEEWLHGELGVAPTITADSGNGYHLLYQIDHAGVIPAAELGAALQVVRSRFATDLVEVDTRLGNPSRVIKLYGTWSRKGHETLDRPWRQSAILRHFDPRPLTHEDLLAFLARHAPPRLIAPVPAPVPAPAKTSADNRVERAARYARTLDPSISGQGGHDKLYRAAAVIGIGFGLDRDACRRILLSEFNPRCQPPWTEREIDHKLTDVYTKEIGSWESKLRQDDRDLDPGFIDDGPPPPPPEPPAPPEDNAPAPAPRPAPGRPRIEITTDEHEVIKEVLVVVGALNTVYTRAGVLVEVAPGDPGLGASSGAVIRVPSKGRVRELVSKAAELGRNQVVEVAPGVRERKWVPCHVPSWLPLAIADRGGYGCAVRPIEAVIDAPTIRPDGSILDQRGYDAATRLYLSPGVAVEPIPDDPRPLARDAAARLLDLVGDFPWLSPEHAGVWVAGLLALVGRPAIEGPLPLWLISANTPGSGKDLLADVLSAIALGTPAPVTPVPPEEEFGKLLAPILMTGQRLVLLGNVSNGGEVGFPALDAALTSTIVQARILGASELFRARHQTLWIATGNNVTPRHDLFRRCMPVRLESPLERPETRTDFRINGCPCCNGDIIRHALTRRGDYLRDCLILLRSFALAEPVANAPTIGYRAFERAVLHPLGRLLGLDLTATRRGEEADGETVRIQRAVVAGWRELPEGKTGISAKRALHVIEQANDRHEALREALLEWSNDDRLPSARTLGNRLKSMKGRVFGGWRLVEASRARQGLTWRAEPAIGPATPKIAAAEVEVASPDRHPNGRPRFNEAGEALDDDGWPVPDSA